MFFISLFMCVFCVLGASTAEARLSSQYEFDDLATKVQQLLQNEEMALALQTLQRMVLDQEVSSSVLERKIDFIKTALAAAAQSDPNKRAILRAKQENEYAEKLKLLAKIRQELGKLEREVQEYAQKEVRGDIASSVCSTVTVITSGMLPYTITLPGHYCLGNDVFGFPTPIVITASNVELSLDTHSIDGAIIGIVIADSANVKISGIGRVSNCNTGILVLRSKDVDIEDISLIAHFETGISSLESDHIEVKRCFVAAGLAAVSIAVSGNIKICSSTFTDSGCGVLLDGSVNNVAITNCFFNDNLRDVATGTSNSGTCTSLLIDRCFMNSTLGGDNIDLGSVTGFSLSNTALCNNEALGSAVRINNSRDIQISNCQMLSHLLHGMIFTGTTQNVWVSDCEVLNAQTSGITAEGLVEGEFNRCLFTSSSPNACKSMYFSKCTSIRVSESVCSAITQSPEVSGTNGVVFDECKGFSLTDCTVETNGRSSDNLSGSSLFISNGCHVGVIQDCLFSCIQPNIATFAILTQGESKFLRFIGNTIDGSYRGGVRFEGVKFSQITNNFIRGVQQGSGITLKESVGIAVINNVIANNETHGIHLDKDTKESFIYGNTVQNNKKIGIKNNTDSDVNRIYHNFARNNHEHNYSGVPLVAEPAEYLGALENISG